MSKKKKEVSSTSSKKPRINGAKKGKQFERDVSNALGHIFPAAERMLEYQASGNVGIDIQGTGNFKIQCKRNAGYAPISRIHEVRSKDQNDIPVLVTKGNRMDTMAVVPFDKFIYMLEVMHGLAPQLKKPEDGTEKEIYNESEINDEFKPDGNGILNKDKIPHTVTSTSHTIIGLPIFEDSDLSDTEISIVGIRNNNDTKRLLTHSDKGIISDLLRLKDAESTNGMDVQAVHCASWRELEHLVDKEGKSRYYFEPEKTTTGFINSLI